MSHASETPISVARRAGAVFITLDRPAALNALAAPLVVALREELARLRLDTSLQALVITGAGDKAFSAGADLKERLTMTLDETRAFVTTLNLLFDDIAAFPRPVIAAINGLAVGGGLELALACDIRIAATGAELGLPEVRIGIIPGAGGTQRLPRLIGIAAAKELILTGRRVNASRAKEIGLVSEIVPRTELDACAERWVAEIAQCAPLAMAQAKRAIDGGIDLPLTEGQAVERAHYELVLASEDRNEGLRAFAEKRKPAFTGR